MSQEAISRGRPLAERMRPRSLSGFVGQNPVVGPDSALARAIADDHLFSMILWGPPGCGKTTLARIIANETRSHFVSFSAVLSGVKDIREVNEAAKRELALHHRRTLLFVDDIHRFNKAQQDAFLHHVESGLITLIGATTENPSFEVIPALMSRCRVMVLEPVGAEDMAILIGRALADTENGLGDLGLGIAPEALDFLIAAADGDVRFALNGLEIIAAFAASKEAGVQTISLAHAEAGLQKKALRYDKSCEEHYNLISALHKSLRGSDPDAAVYWLLRMLSAGEDALFVARRMVRFASEDIGNADPFALSVALNAMEAFRFLGHPEGDLALVQAAVYLATAPKSNRVYAAEQEARAAIERTGALPVPLHIRNAPTRLMKSLGYGRGYKYAHDFDGGHTEQTYLPEALQGESFYRPTDRGFEKTIGQRLAHWRRQAETGRGSSDAGSQGEAGRPKEDSKDKP